MKKLSVCPLCGLEYHKKRRATHHHIFPRAWYPNSTLLVEVCSDCHQEFNREYVMDLRIPWREGECIWNWVMFCRSKGKDALKIYPQILEAICD